MGDRCEHKFGYLGVKFKIGYSLPGTGAREVTYYDVYFCEKCLATELILLPGEYCTYDKILYNASPLGE